MENEQPQKDEPPQEKPKPFFSRWAALIIGFASAALLSMSTEMLQSFVEVMGEASRSQVAQAGFFFTIASLIHSGRMKKEIRANFEALTISIDRVSLALREDLRNHDHKLSDHGEKLDNLTNRVDKLEIKTVITRPQVTQ